MTSREIEARVAADEPAPRKPLRLWPGVVAVVLQWLSWLVVPIVAPDAPCSRCLAAVACGLAVLVWWLFFSRAPWAERVGAIVLMVVAVVATKRVVHESIANGMMGMMLPIYAIPALSLALVAAAVASRRLSSGSAACVDGRLHPARVRSVHDHRTGGITGDADSDFHWRWTPTPEERLLAQAGDEPLEAAPDRRRPRLPCGDARVAGPAEGAVEPAPSTPAPASVPAAGRLPRREDGCSRRRAAGSRCRSGWSEIERRAGPAFADLIATASFAACGSRRTGPVAAGRAVAPADRTGLVVLRGPRESSSTPRSSAATTRSSPATT